MRKFLIRSLWFACFLFFVFSAVIFALVTYNKSRHIYHDAYSMKVRMLAEVPSPRVAFLGGSNLAFGIDSRMVKDSLGVNVVNYGLQAGLGMRVMLADALRYCREGDILVIAPEYEHFYGNAFGEKRSVALSALLHPEVMRSFAPENFSVMAKGFFGAVGVLTERLKSKGSASDPAKYPYSSGAFNDFGDEVAHWSFPVDELEVKHNYLEDDFDEAFFGEFVACFSRLEDMGVRVVIIPPSLSARFYEEYKSEIQYVEKRLSEAGIPFAYPQVQSVFERPYIFDSDYHLSRSGIDRRMPMVVGAIRSRCLPAASADSSRLH